MPDGSSPAGAEGLLRQVIPFRYLDPGTRRALAPELSSHTFRGGEQIIRQGDPDDRRVYLIAEGGVEAVDLDAEGGSRHVALIRAGQYFGERSVLFGEPRTLEVRALETTRLFGIGGDRFLALLRSAPVLAHAFAAILRQKQGLFASLDAFVAELHSAVDRGRLDLPRLLPLYQRLHPVLHERLDCRDEIDFAALGYALRRLPENVTRTLAYYLTDSLPALLSEPGSCLRPVPTQARRRAIYELLPGKDMVLLRDGISDLLDFTSCLCVYAIEARKLRRRVQSPAELAQLATGALPEGRFSPAEREALARLWPDSAAARVMDVALHHEDIQVEVHKRVDNYSRAHTEEWTAQVAQATRELLGCDPADLPPDVPVHVISSNMHAVPNCLSAWLAARADEILAWGARARPGLERRFAERFDAVYALGRDFLAAHPERARERLRAEREAGILRMQQTAYTGIEVQLVDTRRLGKLRDPGLEPGPHAPALLVNVDYAFGQQAQHLLGNVLTLFGRNLASVNVLGKAGGLSGRRGDVLVATAFVEQTSDAFHSLPAPGEVAARLAARVPGRGVHVGPLLTVAGTLLQNRKVLEFNRHIWGCVGLEMEGTFYLRELRKAMDRGLVSDALEMRFLYYVSDMPLDPSANLAGPLAPWEGLPPLYAVTREILAGIFGYGAEPERGLRGLAAGRAS